MTMSPQEARILREKVETLNGDRGDPQKAAARRADIEAVKTLVGDLKQAAAKVLVSGLTSSDLTTPPTASDFNALRADVVALHQALSDLIAGLQ